MSQNTTNPIFNFVGGNNSAGTSNLTVVNTSLTSVNSDSALSIKVNGAPGENMPYMQYIHPTTSFAAGINSVTPIAASSAINGQNALWISNNATPTTPNGGTPLWQMTTTGARLMSLQPLLFIFLNSDTPLAIGSTQRVFFDTQESVGTTTTANVTVGTTDAATYNKTNGQFFAPYTGRYLVSSVVEATNGNGGATDYISQMWRSTDSHTTNGLTVIGATSLPNTFPSSSLTRMLFMNEGDFFYITMRADTGTPGGTVMIHGSNASNNPVTYLSVSLYC